MLAPTGQAMPSPAFCRGLRPAFLKGCSLAIVARRDVEGTGSQTAAEGDPCSLVSRCSLHCGSPQPGAGAVSTSCFYGTAHLPWPLAALPAATMGIARIFGPQQNWHGSFAPTFFSVALKNPNSQCLQAALFRLAQLGEKDADASWSPLLALAHSSAARIQDAGNGLEGLDG